MFWDSKSLFWFYKGIFTNCLQMPYKSNRGILPMYYTFRYFQKSLHSMFMNSIICLIQAYHYFPATIWIYGGTRNWTAWWHISTTSLVILLYFVIPVIIPDLPICCTLSSMMLFYFVTLFYSPNNIISIPEVKNRLPSVTLRRYCCNFSVVTRQTWKYLVIDWLKSLHS